jgi:hypothetical protein
MMMLNVESELVIYNDNVMLCYMSYMSTSIASLLLTILTMILGCVQNKEIRLGLAAFLTSVFVFRCGCFQ